MFGLSNPNVKANSRNSGSWGIGTESTMETLTFSGWLTPTRQANSIDGASRGLPVRAIIAACSLPQATALSIKSAPASATATSLMVLRFAVNAPNSSCS